MDTEKLIYREELVLASKKKRTTALFIDDFILSILLFIILWESISQAQTASQMIYIINTFMLEFMIIKIVYQTFFIYQYGATIGKMILKIKVISIDGASGHTFAMALNRAIFRIISELLFYLGFLWGYFDEHTQTLHDKTSKTIVIDID
jgi:uncharacterized RDD family membrane protein YckC